MPAIVSFRFTHSLHAAALVNCFRPKGGREGCAQHASRVYFVDFERSPFCSALCGTRRPADSAIGWYNRANCAAVQLFLSFDAVLF